MKTISKQLFRLFVLAFFATSQIQVFANDTYYYRDCHVKLNSPSSAKGVVYLEMVDQSNKNAKNPTLQTKPGKTAELKANISNGQSSFFNCLMFAYPKDGYALAGFVEKQDYLAHRTSEEYYLKGNEDNTFINLNTTHIYRNGERFQIAKIDTLIDSKNNPLSPESYNSYKFSAKTTIDIYAVFRKAETLSLVVKEPGTLRDKFWEHGRTWRHLDNFYVEGKINENDIIDLGKLCKSLGIARLDLSQAEVEVIPAIAFYGCTQLYELKLPKSGLKKIGNAAFKDCRCLKSFTIPSNCEIGENVFEGCITWNIKL